MSKGVLCDGIYYCEHINISAKDEDISNFCVKYRNHTIGLENYIKYSSFSDEEIGLMRTYIVRDVKTEEMVGYFSLKAGLVSLNEREVQNNHGENEVIFDTAPGVEVANYAMNERYCEAHPETKGIGILIFRHFIQSLVRQVAEIVGARVMYIFALPIDSLIERYRNVYGFRRFDAESEFAIHKRIKPIYDKACIFMYQLI
ncbi:MAG: hypothetical protein IJ661_03370 [Lachnospiraceae bacterium]|nr:hypothetical protein [Lachnospiraceae bacterium]